eukprot:m.12729 g.12729  ORF g.12729 m.12729 type:complete len:915 (-) comp3257_c0_seq2:161-2905(-)
MAAYGSVPVVPSGEVDSDFVFDSWPAALPHCGLQDVVQIVLSEGLASRPRSQAPSVSIGRHRAAALRVARAAAARLGREFENAALVLPDLAAQSDFARCLLRVRINPSHVTLALQQLEDTQARVSRRYGLAEQNLKTIESAADCQQEAREVLQEFCALALHLSLLLEFVSDCLEAMGNLPPLDVAQPALVLAGLACAGRSELFAALADAKPSPRSMMLSPRSPPIAVGNLREQYQMIDLGSYFSQPLSQTTDDQVGLCLLRLQRALVVFVLDASDEQQSPLEAQLKLLCGTVAACFAHHPLALVATKRGVDDDAATSALAAAHDRLAQAGLPAPCFAMGVSVESGSNLSELTEEVASRLKQLPDVFLSDEREAQLLEALGAGRLDVLNRDEDPPFEEDIEPDQTSIDRAHTLVERLWPVEPVAATPPSHFPSQSPLSSPGRHLGRPGNESPRRVLKGEQELRELLLPPQSGIQSNPQTNGDDYGACNIQQEPSAMTDSEALRASLLMALVGFFFSLQPSEPYLTKYLEQDKHISDHDLDKYVWPSDTYASFALLLPIGIIAELVGYRATIGVGLVLREATRLILLFGDGVAWMSIMQVTYAAATGINTVYFAYVFMVLDASHFQRGTAIVHAAIHAGNALGSALAQLLVSYTSAGDHLRVLFYISWGCTTLGLVFFVVLLPKQRRQPPVSLARVVLQRGISATWAEVRLMYSSGLTVILWTLWWIFGFGAAKMINNYYQNQFLEIDPNITQLGTIEAIMEVVAVLGSLVPLAMRSMQPGQHFDAAHWSALFLFVSSFVQGAAYLLSTMLQSSVYYSFAFNIIALGLFALQYALGTALIALCISSPRYVLVFALNSFVAFGLSTAVQAVAANLSAITNTYYYIATAEEAVLVVAVLAVVAAARTWARWSRYQGLV